MLYIVYMKSVCSGSGTMKTNGFVIAKCPECGRHIEIRREGTLRKHVVPKA